METPENSLHPKLAHIEDHEGHFVTLTEEKISGGCATFYKDAIVSESCVHYFSGNIEYLSSVELATETEKLNLKYFILVLIAILLFACYIVDERNIPGVLAFGGLAALGILIFLATLRKTFAILIVNIQEHPHTIKFRGVEQSMLLKFCEAANEAARMKRISLSR